MRRQAHPAAPCDRGRLAHATLAHATLGGGLGLSVFFKQAQVWTKRRRLDPGRAAIQPSEASVAGPAREATGSRIRIGLTLAHTCQRRTVNIEPLHHLMHASSLPFDTARHPPAHADLPLRALLNRAPIAHCEGIDGRAVQAIAIHPGLNVAASQIARATA